MADPKGPETGQGAKAGHSARPRAQTLDLSANDVSAKSETAKSETAKPDQAKAEPATAEPAKAAAPASPTPAAGVAPKIDAAKTEAPRPGAASSEQPKPQPSGAAATSASAAPKPDPKSDAKPTAAAAPKPDDKPGSAQAPSPKPAQSVPPASASPRPESDGVGVFGVAAAAIGGAAIAVLVIALFGKDFMGLGGGDAARMGAAEAKLDAVGRDVAALRAQLSKTAQSTDTSAIDARLADVSKAIEASNGRVGGVEGELKALSAKVSEPPPADPAIAALAGRVEGLELRLQASPTADALASVAARIEGVEARLGELPTKQAVAEVNANVSAMGAKVEAATGPLAARVDAVATALKERPEGDPAARLVVALGALDAAMEAGRPFVNEFEAVKAATGSNAELDALAPYAAKGMPTRSALGAELSAAIGKLAPIKSETTGSVFERFVANAGGVVKITPQKAGSGSDPEAIRAQVAAAGAAGDIEGALAARGRLDEAARAATDDWANRASALVSAEAAIGSARTAALARLTAND